MKANKRESTGSGYDARKAEILRISASIIRRKGFTATRIDDIAEGVGLTKAGLYHYVSKKADVLAAIMEHALEQLEVEVLLPTLAQKEPEQRLRTLLGRLAHILIDEHDLMLTLFDEFGRLTPGERRHLVPRKRELIDLLKRTLDELQAAGKIRKLESSVAVFNLLAPVLWLPRWYRPRGRLHKDEVVDETLRFIMAGLLI